MNSINTIAAVIGCMLLYSSAAQGSADECTEQQIAKLSCITIEGELQVWNGWPPPLRIESKDKKNVYGLVYSDEEIWPDKIRALHDSGVYRANGSFVICPTGAITSVPYDERQIEIICLKSMTVNGRE